MARRSRGRRPAADGNDLGPGDGQAYAIQDPSRPTFAFSCAPGAGGTLAGCVGVVGATAVANGAPIDTSMPGTFTLTVTATQTDGTSASQAVTYTVARIATRLTATPLLLGGLTVTLTRSDTGDPLPGEQVVFKTDGRSLCSATTNTSGTATCQGGQALLIAVLHLGYQASFGGTATYEPASARAGLLARG